MQGQSAPRCWPTATARAEGYFADVVIFDPATVADTATYEKPHQYPVGIDTVIVNGVVTIRNGKHTGAHAGRALFGPGYKPAT